MIKENNRQIILLIAFIAVVLAIIIRSISEIRVIIELPHFTIVVLHNIVHFAIYLMLFFLTFFSQKNKRIELLIVIGIIELAQILVALKIGDLHLINYILYLIYISAIVLSILLIVTKNHLNILKIIIIGLFSIHYLRVILDAINVYNICNYLFAVSYLFAFVSIVLVVIQINPTSLSFEKPTKYFYINACYNLILLLTYKEVLFGFRESLIFSYMQLILILILLSVQGVLLFYNKNIASYIVMLIGIFLLTIYFIGFIRGMEIRRLIGNFIVLVVGYILYFVLIFKETNILKNFD